MQCIARRSPASLRCPCVDPINGFYLFTVLVLLPAIAVRSARDTRAVLESQQSAAPVLSRLSIYVRVLVLQLIYGGFTVFVAAWNEIPIFVAPPSWWAVAVIALGVVAVKFAAVQSRREWFRTDTGPAVDGLAPRLEPREFTVFGVLCISTGLAEELTYRLVAPVLLYRLALDPTFGPWIALAVTSTAFAVLHAPQRARGMLFAGLFGAVNLLLVWWTGSIWTAVISHAAYDLVAGIAIARRRDMATHDAAR